MRSKLYFCLFTLALLVPAAASAAISSAQREALLALLRSFHADSATVAAVSAALGGRVDGASTVTLSRTLFVGSSGADVKALQQFLADNGYVAANCVTGVYGACTKNGVGAYQVANGIAAPGSAGYGVAGPKTLASISKAISGASTASGSQAAAPSGAPRAAAGYDVTASPNPVVIAAGTANGATTVTWTVPEGATAQLWDLAPGFGWAKAGCVTGPQTVTTAVDWLPRGRTVFNLYRADNCDPIDLNGRAPDASVAVTADLDSTPPPPGPIQPPSQYGDLKAATWYEFGPTYAQTMANLRAQMPRIRAAGFNAVWIVTPWHEMEPAALPAAQWNEDNFTALKQTLDAGRANHLQVLIGLDYLGRGWSPEGIDACSWTENGTMYQAFVDYAKGFLERIDGYQDVGIILVFTENAEPCDLNHYSQAQQIAAILRPTLGNLPNELPADMRAKWRIGYHDFDEINLNWAKGESPIQSPISFDFVSMVAYGFETLTDAQIPGEIYARAQYFKKLYPDTPLIIGEYGAQACAADQEQNQARVNADILTYALATNLGSSVWSWNAETTHGAASDCSFKLAGAGNNILNVNGSPRPAATAMARILGGSIVALSHDGATLTPASSGSLTTADGTWTFGTASDLYGRQILLNGHDAAGGRATTLLVAQGGHLFAQNAYGSWYEWEGSNWLPLAPSPDGAYIAAENSKLLVSADAIWYLGGAITTNGALPYRNGVQADTGRALSLLIAQKGRVFAHRTDGSWYQWGGSAFGWKPYKGIPSSSGASATIDAATLSTVSATPTLTGRAKGATNIRVTAVSANGARQAVASAKAGSDGAWSATLRTLAPGTYGVKVYDQDDGEGGVLAANGALIGSGVLTVWRSADFSISASPNPCTIASGATTCSTTVSWTAPDNVVTQVWVATPGQTDQLFACQMKPSQSLSQDAPWITSYGATFKLYQTSSCSPGDIAGRSPFASVGVQARR